MKKIVISREGINPISISVDNDGHLKGVESAGVELAANVELTTDENAIKDTESLHNNSDMTVTDKVFAECFSVESSDPGRSEEAMPRLSGIKPVAFFSRNRMNRNIYIESVDKYMEGQAGNIEKVKAYLEKKKWTNLGVGGLSRIPTIITSMFKVFGQEEAMQSSRKQIFEKEYNGLKVVWIYTDNSNASQNAIREDIRSAKDSMVGYLILTTNVDGETFFSKQLTPIIRINRADNGMANRANGSAPTTVNNTYNNTVHNG